MPAELTARVIERVKTPDGVVADLLVVEPNGDETFVRCTCFPTTTEVNGEGELVSYLNDRYGDRVFSLTLRRAALGIDGV